MQAGIYALIHSADSLRRAEQGQLCWDAAAASWIVVRFEQTHPSQKWMSAPILLLAFENFKQWII